MKQTEKESIAFSLLFRSVHNRLVRGGYMKPVTKMISFEDLFPKESSRAERIKRWNRWKALVASEPEQIANWGTNEECLACPRYCQKSDWCDNANLPPSVDPVRSFRNGTPGYACGPAIWLNEDHFNAVAEQAVSLGYIKEA